MTDSAHGSPPQRAVFLLNGSSVETSDEPVAELCARTTAEFGCAPDIHVTESGEELVTLAQRTAQDGAGLVVAGGGDGTVGAVAGALAGTAVPLAVLPLGTLNHLAKDLDIPLDLEAALRNAFTGQALRIDVGEVNGRVFVNNSSLGLYPSIVRRRERQQDQGSSKWVAFAGALLAVLRRHGRMRIRLDADSVEAHARVTPFVFIGNNRYEAEGFDLGTRSALTDGRLWVSMARKGGAAHLTGLALRALFRGLGPNDLDAFEATELRIDTHAPRIQVATDGEVTTMDTPLRYRIRPRALSVIVPRGTA